MRNGVAADLCEKNRVKAKQKQKSKKQKETEQKQNFQNPVAF